MDKFTRVSPDAPQTAFDVVLGLQDGLVLLDHVEPAGQLGLDFDVEEEHDAEHAAFGVVINGKMYRVSVERLG